MIEIKSVDIMDSRIAEKKMIFAPMTQEEKEKRRDEVIMSAVTNQKFFIEPQFFKFEPKGIPGAERIKNANSLWCDVNGSIWQVLGGFATDMNDNQIENCCLVRKIGAWW